MRYDGDRRNEKYLHYAKPILSNQKNAILKNRTQRSIRMHTIKLNVQDSIYEHIMFLLNSLNSKGLEIIEDKENKDTKVSYFEDWTKEELSDIGKIGFVSDSFVDDSEDYSKW